MTERLTGITLIATMICAMLVEWHGPHVLAYPAALGIIIFLVLATPQVGWSRRVFVIAGIVLFLIALFTRADWRAMTETALATSAFIAAFFTALASLRDAAATSPAVQDCGRFLAEQRPGRRYLALTIGGHLFSLVLNYGSISLLGTLAEASARSEPDLERRGHRIRRMLLAIQRGFVSTLAWSPLAFSMAISTALVPGASWAKAVLPCLISSLLLAGIGWALDTIFKPRLSTPAPPRNPTGSWASVLPMLLLLTMLVSLMGGLHMLTGVRAVGVVMLVVPLIALGWVAMQNRSGTPLKQTASRASTYIAGLHVYRPELVLLIMAGFIGTIGSRLLSPMIAASGLDLAVLPAWLILLALFWLILLAGFVGMNPILSVSLIAPLLPAASEMGVSPTAIIVAITAGWALSGACSPYTATTMLIGWLGNVSAWHVGLRWNGPYTLICGLALSIWILIYAFH